MAVKLKKISCTQCGGNDIIKIDVNQYKCASCGSTFAIEKSNKIIKEVHIHIDENELTNKAENQVKAYEILNNVSKDEFIRQAWIALMQEDAPFSAFETDFFDIVEKEHKILVNSFNATVSYSASVGYKREEPYIDYEEYREKVGDTWVTKKRQVTKYKQVVDWSPFSSKRCFETTGIVDLNPENQIDTNEFEKCCNSATNRKSLYFEDDEFNELLDLSDDVCGLLREKHNCNLDNEVYNALPGDCSKDEEFTVEKTGSELNKIYFVSEYEAKIKINDKVHTKKMFPFGEASIFGDEIENNENLQKNLEEKIKKTQELVWDESKKLFITSLVMLVLSILVSLIFSYTSMVTIMFIIAVVFVGVSEFVIKSKTNKIKEQVKKECGEFSSNYKKEQIERLNKKLSSLGLKSVDENELYNLKKEEG